MKVTTHEMDQRFYLSLVAETLADAAWITRFQLNVKREIPFLSANVSKNAEFTQWMSFERKVEVKSSIKG